MLTEATNTGARPVSPKDIWDVIVIGGGVVGCAVTRRFALDGAKTLLLERGGDILSGASKANSAILHTGFDAPPGSLELACIQDGYHEYMEIHARMNLPVLETSALVVAWERDQEEQLDGIVVKACENGVSDVTRISQKQLAAREPGLSSTARGAVHVPQEVVIDPWSAPLAYLRQAVRAGARFHFLTAVESGEFEGENWCLKTNQGRFRGRVAINCTGTSGDILERICRPPGFEIRPRKGQFVVYDKSACNLIDAIILPVPSPTTKGVVLTRTIFGNLLLGPTAEEQTDRNMARVDRDGIDGLIQTGAAMLPGLAQHAITATYAGLRPATQFKDYQISAEPDKNWIGVNGIRSTGLTAALGIAAYVKALYHSTYSIPRPSNDVPEPDWPKMPVLAEHERRSYQTGDGTEIVCHCERVTRGDIEAALAGDVPARTLEALRRRTRVMMGRCGGFYCTARVAEITGDKISPPLAESPKGTS